MNIINNKNLNYKYKEEFGSNFSINDPRFKELSIKRAILNNITRENKNILILEFIIDNNRKRAYIKANNSSGKFDLDLLENMLEKKLLHNGSLNYYEILNNDYF